MPVSKEGVWTGKISDDITVKEAAYLIAHNPFNPANHLPNPMAKMPKKILMALEII